MDRNALFEKVAREAYEKGGFNGVWLYAEKGEIVSKGAIGFRDAENTLPMQVDTIFEMASVTKQFTAAAVMLLVREGNVEADRTTAIFKSASICCFHDSRATAGNYGVSVACKKLA